MVRRERKTEMMESCASCHELGVNKAMAAFVRCQQSQWRAARDFVIACERLHSQPVHLAPHIQRHGGGVK
jgi:hypothetical protein